DELRPAIVALLCNLERVEKLRHVLAVEFLNIESVSLTAGGRVFALSRRRRRVERDRVRVVDQDQIIETEMPGEGTRFGRDAFLHATIAGQTNHMLIENPVLGG